MYVYIHVYCTVHVSAMYVYMYVCVYVPSEPSAGSHGSCQQAASHDPRTIHFPAESSDAPSDAPAIPNGT